MIPSNISTELASLITQVTAAEPLANAPHVTVIALQLNATQLVNDIQTALTTTTLIPNIVLNTDTLQLDTWVAPVDPITIVFGINESYKAVQNQNALSLMRGVCGRALSNLEQI